MQKTFFALLLSNFVHSLASQGQFLVFVTLPPQKKRTVSTDGAHATGINAELTQTLSC